MVATKSKLSITISQMLAELLEQHAKQTHSTKSAIIEEALNVFLKDRLKSDAKELAKLSFEDLPSEEDWMLIQAKIN